MMTIFAGLSKLPEVHSIKSCGNITPSDFFQPSFSQNLRTYTHCRNYFCYSHQAEYTYWL